MQYIFFLWLLTSPVLSADFRDSPLHTEHPAGIITGRTIDAETQDPVGGVQIQIKEAHRSTISDQNGYFQIVNVHTGTYHLRTYRIGYSEYRSSVLVKETDTLRLILKIKSVPLSGEAIVIEADKTSLETQTVLDMSGTKLRQNLGQTIAETVSDEPGMDQRTMGPAPARPVLRGLSGDRLLILEDKGRTGDLSATSADHAVVIDPFTADKIEIIRGPAALMFGSNTLGGVINVERGYIPFCRCDHAGGSGSLQLESKNRGYTTGFDLHHALQSFSFKYDGSMRSAGDIHTPQGTLKNTGITTYNASAGMSYILSDGYFGGAGSYYQSEYGIPGGFVGAHPNGVKIKLNRKHVEGKADWHFDKPFFDHQELNYSFSNYFHREFESNGSIGTQFSVLSYNLHWQNHFKATERLKEATYGVWGEYRSYVPGGYIFTPDTKEWTGASYFYQHWNLKKWSVHSALRVDHRMVLPADSYISKIGHIRNRNFTIFSGALSGMYHFSDLFRAGISCMRSGRAPGIEEFYSEGPHLAAYSFEVGNPDLNPETGYGLEGFVKFTSEFVNADIAVFRNDIRHFIFPENTGTVNIATSLPVYQYVGINAVMQGMECNVETEIDDNLKVLGFISYVHGVNKQSGSPLPSMPPLNGKMEVRKSLEHWMFSVTMRASDKQNRVAEFEQPTKGYVVFDSAINFTAYKGKFLHTFVLSVENIADTEYRRHLSRVRSIMPEPGRNIKMLYKVFL